MLYAAEAGRRGVFGVSKGQVERVGAVQSGTGIKAITSPFGELSEIPVRGDELGSAIRQIKTFYLNKNSFKTAFY